MNKNENVGSPTKAQLWRDRASRLGRCLLDPEKPWLYIWVAFALVLVIESLARHAFFGSILFLVQNPIAFLICVGMVASTLLLSLFCPKRIPMLACLAFVWFFLGMTEFILLFNRVTPLTAVDFSVFFSVLPIMDNYLKKWQIVGIIVGLILCIAGLVFLFIRAKTCRFRWKRAVISLVSAVGATALLIVTGFACENVTSNFTNLKNAYDDYGFAYCFLVSIVDRGVDKPDAYGQEYVQGILETIPNKADGSGEQTATRPNVIIVQLESFFDVTTLQGVTYSKEPLPNLRQQITQYPNGLLEVPVIGAGTVNSEFEILTGMRVQDFGAAEYPFKSILTRETCETVAYDLLKSGYRTHAIHNHQGSFYGRDEVYKHLGFEDFTSIEYFRDPEFNENSWAKDTLLTEEILELINGTAERDLVFAVSVQAHGKYPSEYRPGEDDVYVTGGIEDAESLAKLNYYLGQLYEVDQFIGELYRAVMELEEETVLVFYGDHLPSLAGDECLTLTTGEYQTPYWIIANYDLDMSVSAGGELYAYQLFPLVMQLIGNDEGLINRFHAARKGTDNYLEDLATLEYDILYGEKYALDEQYPIMENMTMGTRPISVTSVTVREDGFIYVSGENFTLYSVVAIDGSERDTQFVDEHTLIAEKGLLDDLSFSSTMEVTVRQTSRNAKTLSETAPFIVDISSDTSGK